VAHGGSLVVANRTSGGALFTGTLPRLRHTAAPAEAAVSAVSAQRSSG
jgi:hypothetical protein